MKNTALGKMEVDIDQVRKMKVGFQSGFSLANYCFVCLNSIYMYLVSGVSNVINL